jgi:hypothetical protein
LAAYFLLWIPTSYRIDGATFEAGNYANLVLSGLVVAAVLVKKGSVQAAMVLMFTAVLAWATIFVWAQTAL